LAIDEWDVEMDGWIGGDEEGDKYPTWIIDFFVQGI
jgi:hypothetical protein